MPVPHVVLVLGLLLSLARNGAAQRSPIGYAIDLTDRADDLFRVTAWVSGLTPDNAIYQFASTAPGTYQVMNIGRYVKELRGVRCGGRPGAGRAGLGQPVAAERRRRGSGPSATRSTETWDSPVDHPIYKMCGTSIEADHVLINPHAVIGYPEGLQAAPVRLRLAYPAAWTVGTALHRGPDGVFVADSYDQLVDSPFCWAGSRRRGWW